jgi:AraC family transcriptional regulator
MNKDHSSATSSAGYGARLGKGVGADTAPTIVTRTLQGAEVAVTEVKVDEPNCQLSDPLPPEDAYLVVLVLKEVPTVSYAEGSRHIRDYQLHAHATSIYDMRRDPRGRIMDPFHTLTWYLPHEAMRTLADEAHVPFVEDLRFEAGTCVVDETVQHLGRSVLPALRAPDQVNRLFVDNMALALSVHVAQTYGGMGIASQPIPGGLAFWQERRAKDLLMSDLAGSTPLREIAAACDLSIGHFSRAFRKSTGLPPHAWLISARIEAAKTLLSKRGMPLSEIALSCGFADQTHFTRVFAARAGMSPGAWRRTILD